MLSNFKYKLGLIKTLTDKSYKVNNTTQFFHNDIKNVSEILKRNIFPKWLLDKSVKGYLSKVGYYSYYAGRKSSSIINKYST